MKPEVLHSAFTYSLTVSDTMVATLDGQAIHPVYSTFWLAYHAEVAARKAIEPYFEEGEDAVGGGIKLRHMAMAAIGATVSIEAKVVSANAHQIHCSITAYTSSACIAQGSQIQIVLPKKRIQQLIQQAYTAVENKKV